MHSLRSVPAIVFFATLLSAAVPGAAGAGDASALPATPAPAAPSGSAPIATAPRGVLEITPEVLTFGRSGDTALVTLRNRGAGPLVLSALRLASIGDSDFATSALGRRSLDPGQSYDVRVT